MNIIPKAKPVRFRIVSNGHECDSLETLYANFNFEDVKQIILDGRIYKWLHSLHNVNVDSLISRLKSLDLSAVTPLKLLSVIFPNYEFERAFKESSLAYLKRIEKIVPEAAYQSICKDFARNDKDVFLYCLNNSLLTVQETKALFEAYEKRNALDSELSFLFGKLLLDNSSIPDEIKKGELLIEKSERSGYKPASKYIQETTKYIQETTTVFHITHTTFFKDLMNSKIYPIVKNAKGNRGYQVGFILGSNLKDQELEKKCDSILHIEEKQLFYLMRYCFSDYLISIRHGFINEHCLNKIDSVFNHQYAFLNCLKGFICLAKDNDKAYDYFNKSKRYRLSKEVLDQWQDKNKKHVQIPVNFPDKTAWLSTDIGLEYDGNAANFLYGFFLNLLHEGGCTGLKSPNNPKWS